MLTTNYYRSYGDQDDESEEEEEEEVSEEASDDENSDENGENSGDDDTSDDDNTEQPSTPTPQADMNTSVLHDLSSLFKVPLVYFLSNDLAIPEKV